MKILATLSVIAMIAVGASFLNIRLEAIEEALKDNTRELGATQGMVRGFVSSNSTLEMDLERAIEDFNQQQE